MAPFPGLLPLSTTGQAQTFQSSAVDPSTTSTRSPPEKSSATSRAAHGRLRSLRSFHPVHRRSRTRHSLPLTVSVSTPLRLYKCCRGRQRTSGLFRWSKPPDTFSPKRYQFRGSEPQEAPNTKWAAGFACSPFWLVHQKVHVHVMPSATHA